LPATFAAQLATLVKSPPPGDEWLHELKYDGYRIGCRIDDGEVRLLSRNGNDWTERFPTVAAAAAKLKLRRALLDGEIAVVLPDGRTSFQALQNSFAGGAGPGEIVYFVFDLLHLDGEDVSRLALEERKARLRRLLGAGRDLVRYSEHLTGQGERIWTEACRQGAEGIVSKRRDLPYQPGRGPGWLKTKCIKRQEFVIGGFTDPEGSRVGIGALLVGVRDAHRNLMFAGKVGTGFTQASARALRQRLDGLEQRECPFTPRPPGPVGRSAHWVRPELVAEVAFTEWTGDGKIRHPSFQGLREDKSPADIVRERPVSAPAKRYARRTRAPRTKRDPDPVIAGVRISHPDRILYPESGLTKRELATFYESIAEWILPHLAGRPLTLVRCPTGVGESCFYMKHAHVWAPPGLRRVRIREKTKVGEYLVADSLTALIGLAQMDVLEIHTWNSRVDHVEEPDRIVLDLDPGPRVEWAAVIAGARLIRTALDGIGLRSFVKNTGGHGLHVVVPLEPVAPWSECLALARAVAEAMERLEPRSYTTAFAKAGRETKILIDYLRNNRTNTSVAAFSTRARPHAPVSVTLEWDELSGRVPADHYTVRTVPARLARLGRDPWREYWTARQRIPADAVARLGAVRR
jgi:bifunctional non-homologous end joining protein LigD